MNYKLLTRGDSTAGEMDGMLNRDRKGHISITLQLHK